MKKAVLIALVLSLAVAVGVVVWRTSDDGSRREAALVETRGGNVLSSPNGEFSLSVEDDGIVMKGPIASVELTGGGLKLKSAGTLSIQGTGPGVTVQGAMVSLCGGGGTPVARVGDPVMATAPGVPGQILQGSTTVYAC